LGWGSVEPLEVSYRARHGLDPAVDVVEARQRPHGDVGAALPQTLDREEGVRVGDLLVVGAVVDADRRLGPPLVDRVLAQADAEWIVWITGHAGVVGPREELARGR